MKFLEIKSIFKVNRVRPKSCSPRSRSFPKCLETHILLPPPQAQACCRYVLHKFCFSKKKKRLTDSVALWFYNTQVHLTTRSFFLLFFWCFINVWKSLHLWTCTEFVLIYTCINWFVFVFSPFLPCSPAEPILSDLLEVPSHHQSAPVNCLH